jgi:hypothetical protein
LRSTIWTFGFAGLNLLQTRLMESVLALCHHTKSLVPKKQILLAFTAPFNVRLTQILIVEFEVSLGCALGCGTLLSERRETDRTHVMITRQVCAMIARNVERQGGGDLDTFCCALGRSSKGKHRLPATANTARRGWRQR